MKMNATEVARKYHETWNGRAADALVGAFTKDGTFCNPDTYPGIRGEALAAFVKGVWTAIPDFSIEMLNAGEIEPGLVAHHWLIQAAELRPSRVIRTSPTGALQCDVGGGRIEPHIVSSGNYSRGDGDHIHMVALSANIIPTKSSDHVNQASTARYAAIRVTYKFSGLIHFTTPNRHS
jgi:SnoaL-like domain